MSKGATMSYEDDKPFLKFPCEFPIKVVGLANGNFKATALTIIRQHCPDLAETALQTRTSKNGK